jgi:hypothetical protein
VDLPGVKELKNAFVSKSDSAITARPDFDKISEELKAVSDSFNFADSDDQDDYLNSASGIYGTSDALWFSKQSPITWDGTASSIACSQYTTGTVTILTASTSVAGVGTEWLQNAWYGCFIEFDGDGVYYKITSVNSDTSLTLSEPLPAGINHSGVSYSIYRTHQPDHADYKLNLQPFTSGMIYSCPTITMPVNANKICGPFYASVVETSSDNVWVNVQDDDLEADGNGVLNGVNENIATDGTNWIAFTGALDGDNYTMAKSSDPTDDWESVTPPSNFTPYGSITCYGSRFYIAGLSTDGGNLAAYAYTDNLGSTWHIVKHDADTTIASSVGVLPSGRVVLVAGTSGPSFKFAYYTDDPLTATPTWTDCAFSGSPSGRRGENIYYLNGTLVIPCSNFLGGTCTQLTGPRFPRDHSAGLILNIRESVLIQHLASFMFLLTGPGPGPR